MFNMSLDEQFELLKSLTPADIAVLCTYMFTESICFQFSFSQFYSPYTVTKLRLPFQGYYFAALIKDIICSHASLKQTDGDVCPSFLHIEWLQLQLDAMS